MFFEFKDELRPVDINAIFGTGLYAGILSLQELKEYNHILGFSEAAIAECCGQNKSFRSSIDVYDDYSFGLLSIIDAGDVFGERDRMAFFIKENLFLLVSIQDIDKSNVTLFEYVVNHCKPCNVTLEKLIYSFFERLIYKDNATLETIEFQLNKMEEDILTGKLENQLNAIILMTKKKLLLLRSYYEQLIDICEELGENENDLFVPQHLHYFRLFASKAERLSGNVQMLRENLVQVREAYQASMDYNLNSIMKIFTVVTTIFLPLTLIVGWYGMNFTTMPELTWRYGYIGVIVLSVLVIIGCIVLFKKKKLL
ncbi:MAG: CorA family divalent cation transporter [Oscillospiraceae bacterium]|nr:CorA family divalent cation transporter [Oscillospiraceae bacterium]